MLLCLLFSEEPLIIWPLIARPLVTECIWYLSCHVVGGVIAQPLESQFDEEKKR